MADAKEAIPLGLCQCGCGQATTISTATVPKHGYVKGEPRRFRCGHCHRGRHSNNWAGGRNVANGYVLIHMPEHPRADAGGYVREHVLVAERALGKPLSRAHPIHHVDGDRSNNNPSNLVVCEDGAYHRMLHVRQWAFEACGDANAKRCRCCGTYERQAEIRTTPSGNTYHVDCSRRVSDAIRRKKGRAVHPGRRKKDAVSPGVYSL